MKFSIPFTTMNSFRESSTDPNPSLNKNILQLINSEPSNAKPGFGFRKFVTDFMTNSEAGRQALHKKMDGMLSNMLVSTAKDKQQFMKLLSRVGNVFGEKMGWVRKNGSGTSPCFATISSLSGDVSGGKEAFQISMKPDKIVGAFEEVPLYAVSSPYNEFVLIADPNSNKSLCMLSFREEDAQTLLNQVRRSIRGLQRGSRVVPLTFKQVYKLKAQGISFRFLPDPIQVRNALEIESRNAFLGVPVFQSDLIVLERERQRMCPFYFRKEDLENDLEKTLKKRSRVSQAVSAIMVGSLEEVLKEMQKSDPTSVWKDAIFIPPGRSSSEHVRRLLM